MITICDLSLIWGNGQGSPNPSGRDSAIKPLHAHCFRLPIKTRKTTGDNFLFYFYKDRFGRHFVGYNYYYNPKTMQLISRCISQNCIIIILDEGSITAPAPSKKNLKWSFKIQISQRLKQALMHTQKHDFINIKRNYDKQNFKYSFRIEWLKCFLCSFQLSIFSFKRV